MLSSIQTFLKNTGCSYCQENDFSDDKNINKNWSLYLKESEMYSSLVLYKRENCKDVSYYCNVGDKIKLYQKKKLILELEYISKNDDEEYAILVPDEQYQDYYQDIEKKNKKFDKNLKSYYVDDFDISFLNESKNNN